MKGVHVANNLRWNTEVFYNIEDTNKFLTDNPDYGLLDANYELKVYHCALNADDGEIHDPELNKYIK